jgi:hypothetical protein
MGRTNVPQEFAAIQRESQRAFEILREFTDELELITRHRHAAQPQFAPVPHKPYVITYSRDF